MKYSKIYKHNDGKFYVAINSKKYFLNTASETEEECLEKAAVKSANYYLKQAALALSKCENLIDKDRKWFSEMCDNACSVHTKLEKADKALDKLDGGNDFDYYTWWA